MVRQLRTQFALGWGGMTFVGTPEQITEKLLKTSDAGLDGIVIGFHDYLPEMKHFDETVMPLLKEAGLRHWAPLLFHRGRYRFVSTEPQSSAPMIGDDHAKCFRVDWVC